MRGFAHARRASNFNSGAESLEEMLLRQSVSSPSQQIPRRSMLANEGGSFRAPRPVAPLAASSLLAAALERILAVSQPFQIEARQRQLRAI